MADQVVSSPPSSVDVARKRKRSLESDHSPRNYPSHNVNHDLPSSQNAAGVFIDMPHPSSSAMAAAYNAAQLSPSQLNSHVSLPASILNQIQPETQVASASEYIPSVQAGDTSSWSNAITEQSALQPLPNLSTRVFEPFLDDTTGSALDEAEIRIQQHEQRAERRVSLDNSSPVESFSPTTQQQHVAALMRPEDIPRIGAWILPELTVENSNPDGAPEYTSQEVLSQIPYPISEDEQDELERRLDARTRPSESQASPLTRRSLQSHPSQSASPAQQPPAPPVSSTPAFASHSQQPQRQEESQAEPLPPQPIPSPSQQELPTSTPTLPPPPPIATQPSASHTTSAISSSCTSFASVGWHNLPRPEIIDLVHRSSHIPAFLKDEIERFLLRFTRSSFSSTTLSSSSSSSSSSQHSSLSRLKQQSHPSPPQRRTNSQSQSQSWSSAANNNNNKNDNSNDDSETQEDGFLRTKKLWYMDLLLLPCSSCSTSEVSLEKGLSWEVMQRLCQTQQQQRAGENQGGGGGDSSSSSSGSVVTKGNIAVILLLDMQLEKFDVHELEESLARVLRFDRRYSIHYDCNGRKWNTNTIKTITNSSSSPIPHGDYDEVEMLKAKIVQLENGLEDSTKQIETLVSTNICLEKHLQESRSQEEFVRNLYDRASSSASTAQANAEGLKAKVEILEMQLSQGLAMHSAALQGGMKKWKQRLNQVEAEIKLMKMQRELTEEGSEVRRKAELWDEFQAEERDRQTTREERLKKNEVKRRKLAEQLGGGQVTNTNTSISRIVEEEQGRNKRRVDSISDGLGPFARHNFGGIGVDVGTRELSSSPMDELDELEALAKEAEQAGDTTMFTTCFNFQDNNNSGGRSRRSRRKAQQQQPSSSSYFNQESSRDTHDDHVGGGTLTLKNASNRSPPYFANFTTSRNRMSSIEMAAQVEAANLSSKHALQDSRLDVQDEFETMLSCNTNSTNHDDENCCLAQRDASGSNGQGFEFGLMGDFDSVPSASLLRLSAAADSDQDQVRQDMTVTSSHLNLLDVQQEQIEQAIGDGIGWQSLVTSEIDLPPSFTTESVVNPSTYSSSSSSTNNNNNNDNNSSTQQQQGEEEQPPRRKEEEQGGESLESVEFQPHTQA